MLKETFASSFKNSADSNMEEGLTFSVLSFSLL